jgi:glutamate---cysteine ligase / carboxylate-amine ligase
VGNRNVGVEEEFLLFDASAPRLVDIGPDVVAAAERAGDDDAQFEKELKKAQAELGTQPAVDLTALLDDLQARRGELIDAAVGRGARVVASGTCPVPGTTQTTDNPRYRQMAHRFAAIERVQLTCAMHVHVAVESDDEGVAAINGLAPWLPVLLALSANSPFAGGTDTGYASYRRVVWNSWPTADVSAPFADGAEYHDTVQQLIATGAARDRAMIYFDARLSANYPTVEIRVCDVTADAADAVALAGLCRALVSTVVDDGPPRFRPEVLRAAAWRAARFGMTDDLVELRGAPRLVPARALVDGLLEYVRDALDAAGDTQRITDWVAMVTERGTGAQLQRSAAADGSIAAAVDAMTLAQPATRS